MPRGGARFPPTPPLDLPLIGMYFEALKRLIPLMLEYHIEVYGGLDDFVAIALVCLCRNPQPIYYSMTTILVVEGST